jgi:hypothetical protein
MGKCTTTAAHPVANPVGLVPARNVSEGWDKIEKTLIPEEPGAKDTPGC